MEIKCNRCGDKTIPCSCVIEYRRQQEKARIDMHIEEIKNSNLDPDPDWQGMEANR